eukprot:g19499.t1
MLLQQDPTSVLAGPTYVPRLAFPEGPRQSAQSTKKEAVILIEGDAEPRKSKDDSETKTAQEAPSKTRSVRTAVFSSPLMRRVEGLIEQHAHSSHFIKEVRRYSQSLNLGREVELVFLMLSATVASGIMKTCRTPDVQFLLQQVRAVNPTVADLGHELLLQRQREWYAYQWQTMAGGYPAWGWPGAPGYYPQVRPKKSKKEKNLACTRKDKKDKKKTKGTKRKASSSSSEKEELGKGAQDADLLASFQARFDALLKDSKERACVRPSARQDGSGVPPVAEQSTDTSPSPAARSDCEASTRAVETPGRASKSGGAEALESVQKESEMARAKMRNDVVQPITALTNALDRLPSRLDGPIKRIFESEVMPSLASFGERVGRMDEELKASFDEVKKQSSQIQELQRHSTKTCDQLLKNYAENTQDQLAQLQLVHAQVLDGSKSTAGDIHQLLQANHDLHGVIEQKVDALLWKHTKEHAVTVDFGSMPKVRDEEWAIEPNWQDDLAAISEVTELLNKVDSTLTEFDVKMQAWLVESMQASRLLRVKMPRCNVTRSR